MRQRIIRQAYHSEPLNDIKISLLGFLHYHILIRLTYKNPFPTLLMHTLSYSKWIPRTWNLRIFTKYRSLAYVVNTPTLRFYSRAFCNQNIMLYS